MDDDDDDDDSDDIDDSYGSDSNDDNDDNDSDGDADNDCWHGTICQRNAYRSCSEDDDDGGGGDDDDADNDDDDDDDNDDDDDDGDCANDDNNVCDENPSMKSMESTWKQHGNKYGKLEWLRADYCRRTTDGGVDEWNRKRKKWRKDEQVWTSRWTERGWLVMNGCMREWMNELVNRWRKSERRMDG